MVFVSHDNINSSNTTIRESRCNQLALYEFSNIFCRIFLIVIAPFDSFTLEGLKKMLNFDLKFSRGNPVRVRLSSPTPFFSIL